MLVFVVLAKLAGEDWLRGIAQWMAERQEGLAELLRLANPQAPYYTTYAHILGRAVAADEFEQVVGHFFATVAEAGHSVEIALDGKMLRGTIPLGPTQGGRLLAAYLPAEGVVVRQVAMEHYGKEIAAAPHVLKNGWIYRGKS